MAFKPVLTDADYKPPPQTHTHVCRFYVGDVKVETRHYSAEDARREQEWQATKGYLAQVEPCTSN